ncbi:hypothetical protein UVIVOLLU_CDS0061 [Salmonella phage PHA46_2]
MYLLILLLIYTTIYPIYTIFSPSFFHSKIYLKNLSQNFYFSLLDSG